MNLSDVANPLGAFVFKTWRRLSVLVPGGRVRSFGDAGDQVGAILVVNLDRQWARWNRITRELRRFRTSDGTRLMSITRRLSAVDARDGRAVAATADVDPFYRVGDQLYVQPDSRLANSFADDEPVRMTRQEVAVARSHVEAWKEVVAGDNDFVLILEDDAWFKPGAKSAIDRGWRAALTRSTDGCRPKFLYLSYADAGGTAVREDECRDLFRPTRGLWFLSGYVLSREGAAVLLRAMPVVGPVDLWMNYRFAELGALALSSPVIAQRHDEKSDNAYSMLPYLARAGIVDGVQEAGPTAAAGSGRVLGWARNSGPESLAMALSMLGLRVRVFDDDEDLLDLAALSEAFETFDALVNPPMAPESLTAAAADGRTVWVLETGAVPPEGFESLRITDLRAEIPSRGEAGAGSWTEICRLLDMPHPVEAFPAGAPHEFRLFRDGRARPGPSTASLQASWPMDESPWVLPPSGRWSPARNEPCVVTAAGLVVVQASMTECSPEFQALVETFPGNLSSFARENLEHEDEGVRLTINVANGGVRPYRSAAFVSVRSVTYGRVQAEVRAATGPGLITGLFLHRAAPRQEIDIEFAGSDPRRMLTNVFFNPGDDGTDMSFGYRGSPCWVDLGFDVTQDFHEYAIDWRPGRLTWLVDGDIVHERASWDPTPIPHLAMRVHANVWAPRSQELAGRINEAALPASATFRNLVVAS